MKKIILASVFAAASLFSLSASAVAICAGASTAGSGTAPAAGNAGTNFMVVAITPKCSANVYMDGVDGTGGAWFAAGANSAKGKYSYPASTSSGGVGAGVACAVAGGCTATEAATAQGAANTAAATAAGAT